MSTLAEIEALVVEKIQKQLTRRRRYIAAPERRAIAVDAASMALAVLVEVTGGSDHVVQSDGDSFTVQHPLAERLTGELFACDVHSGIAAGAPLESGRFRVVRVTVGHGGRAALVIMPAVSS